MTSIALAIFTAAIVYVMVWSIKNEDARSIGDQTGFIRMRDPSGATKKPGERSGRFPHAAGGVRPPGNPDRVGRSRPHVDRPRTSGARPSNPGE